jgi:signal transduction histidine kinase
MKQGITIGIISVIVAILVSVLFGTILLKHVSKPLEILDKDIMRISKGDYSGVELKAKSKQINRLESALDELSGQLLKMRTDRENFDKQRKDFFANVSHELRTPITVIRGYAETLNDGVVTDEKMINDYYLRILSECENINALVEDLFALSKMENPDYKFDVEPVSLSQIMDDVVRGARVLADEKSIEIRLSKEGDETFLIIGDYARLRQMFMIIVDNAVKFSEEESFIDITLERIEGNSFRVGIRDYGVGISDEEKKNIFEKFYTSKLRQNEKGTGLGLMIAKNIALRHGSDIGLSSEPGKGSCFMFEFEECTDTSAYE